MFDRLTGATRRREKAKEKEKVHRRPVQPYLPPLSNTTAAGADAPPTTASPPGLLTPHPPAAPPAATTTTSAGRSRRPAREASVHEGDASRRASAGTTARPLHASEASSAVVVAVEQPVVPQRPTGHRGEAHRWRRPRRSDAIATLASGLPARSVERIDELSFFRHFHHELRRGRGISELPITLPSPSPTRSLWLRRPPSHRQPPSVVNQIQRPSPHRMWDGTDAIPAMYRTAAAQFEQAIRHINRMTADTCTTEAKMMLAFVDKQKMQRLQQQRQREAGAYLAGPPSTSPAPPSATPASQVKSVGQSGNNKNNGISHADLVERGVRTLSQVPLLPLTICTDGDTVVLIDLNGTSMHGNYVEVVRAYLTVHAVAIAPADSECFHHPSAPPTSSRVLWWTLAEVQRRRGFVPLTDARASCVDTELFARQLTRGVAAPPASTQQRNTASSLFAFQPDHLSLPYGNGLVLVFTEATTTAGPSANAVREVTDGMQDVQVGRDLPWKAPPPRDNWNLLGRALLRDLSEGHLPSFLEAIYPLGGVSLRGIWCQLNDNEGNPDAGEDGASRGNDEDEVHMLKCSNPLVHLSFPLHLTTTAASVDDTASQTTASSYEDFNAAAAHIMASLRPTSLPCASARPAASTSPQDRVTPVPTLVLPDAVRCLLPDYEIEELESSASDLEAAQVLGRLATVAPMQEDTIARHRKASPPSATQEVTEEGGAHSVDEQRVSHTAVDSDASVIGTDMRTLKTSPAPTFSNSDLVYVVPLLRASAPATSSIAATRTAVTAANSRCVCESVMVLTQLGRVEVVVPDAPAMPSETPMLCSPVTVRDIKHSLCGSAVGQVLQLREEEVFFAYAPEAPPLPDTEVMRQRHVVLRLRRRLTSDG
jgi:hypothetical protein